MTAPGDAAPPGAEVPGWTARPRPEPVRLAGRTVVLEPLTLDHVDALFASLCGPDDDGLWTYLVPERPSSPEALAGILAALLAEPDTVSFAIVPAESGRAEGRCSLMRVDAPNGSIEIGSITYARRLQRTVAATEAMYLLARHVFDDLGYRRYEWKCNSLNEPSRRAAVRLGFSYEGRFRQAAVVKGRNRDTDWFAMVDGEWPLLRAAFEQWLAPANFTSDGGQRTALTALTAAARA